MYKGQKQENDQIVTVYMSKSKKNKKIIERLINILICFLLCPIIVALVVRHCIENRPNPETNSTLPETNNPLPFRNWYQWGGVQAIPNGNTVTLNGMVDTAGYVSGRLPQNISGKTIILEILNAEASVFNQDRLIKITVNSGDQLVHPKNVPDLIQGEYIPSNYKLVEFILPDNFDGKLGFIFYQADLRDLKITMQYK